MAYTGECNNCGDPISWNKAKRDALKTRRPLEIDETEVHVCRTAGTADAKPGNPNSTGTRKYQATGTGTTAPKQETQNFGEKLTAEMLTEFQRQIDELKAAIYSISETQNNLETMFKNFLGYNPMSQALADLVNAVQESYKTLGAIPKAWQPKSAADLKAIHDDDEGIQ